MIENKICLYKKSLFFGVFAILVILFFIEFSSATILINHTAVARFDLYKDDPDFQSAIENAKDSLHIGYGHTSHGSQITSGMFGFNTFMNNLGYPENLFSFNNGGSNGALDLEEGAGYGDGWLDHDCGYSGWDDETRYYLDGSDPGLGTADHSDVNVIMWSWCGQVDGVDIQSHYLDNMADLENEYSDVTFIYMTGHLEGHKTGDSWFDNNNAIRSWVANSNNKVLFDFVDIEKYDPDQEINYADYFADDNCDYDSDGSSPRSEDSNWAVEWQENHVEGQDWYSVGCAHSKSLNCNQKAKAFWYMIARLGGWEGDTEEPCQGVSDLFPRLEEPPTVQEFLPNPTNEYYCAPWGNNTNGDGSFDNPWYDLRGGQGTVESGDLVYFRGGEYANIPYCEHYVYSDNRIITDATQENPIVFSNYPGEQVIFSAPDYEGSTTYDFGDLVTSVQDSGRLYTCIYDGTTQAPDDPVYGVDGSSPRWARTRWLMTLDGDNQKLIGTKIGSEYGFVFYGGVDVDGDYSQVSGVEILKGAANSDGNPAMLSIASMNNPQGVIFSHNYLHDSLNPTDSGANARMVAIKHFPSQDSVIEYNLFENNNDVYQDAIINVKGSPTNLVIRHNKFINNAGGINYVVQDDHHDGLDVYGNLFYNNDQSFYFTNEWGPNFRFYDNVALNIPNDGSFFEYLSHEPVGDGTDRGEYYNNIIDGPGFEAGWSPNSQDLSYMPNVFNYNMWSYFADQNGVDVWGSSFNDLGYDQNSIIAAGEVTYDPITMTATVACNYSGRSTGRYGDNIGGFTFTGSVSSYCGDGICNPNENCINCQSDCLDSEIEVCCSGVVYTGECCSDLDCSSGFECINHNCQESQDFHPADTNPQNGVVSFTEIEEYMNRWLNGEISIDDLLSGINEWRGLN